MTEPLPEISTLRIESHPAFLVCVKKEVERKVIKKLCAQMYFLLPIRHHEHARFDVFEVLVFLGDVAVSVSRDDRAHANVLRRNTRHYVARGNRKADGVNKNYLVVHNKRVRHFGDFQAVVHSQELL